MLILLATVYPGKAKNDEARNKRASISVALRAPAVSFGHLEMSPSELNQHGMRKEATGAQTRIGRCKHARFASYLALSPRESSVSPKVSL